MKDTVSPRTPGEVLIPKEINLLELFSGIGGFSQGLIKAGYKIKNHYFSEVDKHAIANYKYNFKDAKYVGPVGDVKGSDIETPDILTFGSPCFVGGTKILTENGYQNIENLELGVKVLTHTGEYRPIIQKHKHEYLDELVDVTVTCGVEGFKCTKEHPFLVAKKIRTYDNKKRQYIISYSDPQWVKAQDLKENDFLCVTIPKNFTACKIDEATAYLMGCNLSKDCGDGAENKHIPEYIFHSSKSIREVFLKGYMCGDGCLLLNDNYITTTISKRLAYDIQRLVVITEQKLPKVYTNSTRKTHEINGIKINCSRQYTVRWGKKTNTKNINWVKSNNYILVKIKNINKYGTNTTVFNIGVEQDESYCVGLITTHNCQDFSLAGKQLGLGGDRSVLILEAIRIIRETRPRVYIWENVKGAFSSNDGKDFWAIISAFANIGGYRLEWQLINSSWYVPQNRERIYLVGYSDGRCAPGVFPFTEDDFKDAKKRGDSQTVNCLDGNYWKGVDNHGQRTRVRQKPTQQIVAMRGRNPDNPSDRTTGSPTEQRLEVNSQGIANTLTSVQKDNLVLVDKNTPTRINIIGNLKGEGGHECHNVHSTDGLAPSVRENHGKITMIATESKCLSPKRTELGKKIRKDYEAGKVEASRSDIQQLEPREYGVTNTLTSVQKDNLIFTKNYVQWDMSGKGYNSQQDRAFYAEGNMGTISSSGTSHKVNVLVENNIRRLTEVECERLQGFEDGWTEYGMYDGVKKKIPKNQRYKMIGNAVTVDVVTAIAKRLKFL